MQLFSFYTMIDTRVNSNLAKTIIVTFVLKIINSKSVSKTTFKRGGGGGGGFINSQQMWMNFNNFSSSSRVDCAILMNFNLDAVDKG